MTTLRVLHVDDQADIREVVQIALSLDPVFETRSCSSGREALAAAADWVPDIIVLDIMMPGMDGQSTLACLRENVRTADIPVVFMTARAQSRELNLFRSLGAVGVIPKPFDPMTLAASVRRHIQPSDAQLVALQKSFLQRLKDDSIALDLLRSKLCSSLGSPDVLTDTRAIAHRLTGASRILDFVISATRQPFLKRR